MQRRIGDFFGLKRNAVGNQTEKLKKRQKTEVVDLISGDESNAKIQHNFEPKYVYVIVAASGRVLYVGQGSYSYSKKREEMHLAVAIGQWTPCEAEGGWQDKHTAIQHWMVNEDGIKIFKFERLGADAANVIESGLIDATFHENYNKKQESYNGMFEGVSYAGDPKQRPGLAQLRRKLQEQKLTELQEKIKKDTSVLITASTFKLSYHRPEDGAKSNKCECGRNVYNGNLNVCAGWPSLMPKACKNFILCGKIATYGCLQCSFCYTKAAAAAGRKCQSCNKNKVSGRHKRCSTCRLHNVAIGAWEKHATSSKNFS